MATTSIHEITSTVDKTVSYICNKDKTDHSLLISTFACSELSASYEFENTRNLFNQHGKNLARHLIQSFKPGEVTPEQAHEIGIRLADELLKGEYEYIVSTHIDKGHIHNHILINEINFVTGKTFGTEHDKGKNIAWKDIQKISDALCNEYSLSVVPNAERGCGKSHYEWEQSQAKCSWKDKLKETIDDCIMISNDFDDFLKRMEEMKYEYKLRGETLSFKAEGQERFTRCRRKTLGWYYEPEQLRTRIARSVRKRNAPVQYTNGFVTVQDENSFGLQRWAMLKNMQESSKMINILSEYSVGSPEELIERIFSKHDTRSSMMKDIKSLENKLSEKRIILKNINTYLKTKPINDQYKKSFFKNKFYKEHQSDLILYETSKQELKNHIGGNILPNINTLKNDIDKLAKEKTALIQEYSTVMKDLDNLENARSQLETYLLMEHDIEEKKLNGELE